MTTPTMKRFDLPLRIVLSLLAMIGFGSGLSILGCVPENVAGSIPEVPVEDAPGGTSELYTFADVASGLIGGLEFSSGDHVFVFGDKELDETLTKLTAIAIVDKANNLYEFFFDAEGRPQQIRMNGYTWTLSYTQLESGMWQVTITTDIDSVTIPLAAEFNTLYEAAQQSEFSNGDPAGREYNRWTVLGAIKIGLAMTGFIGVAAAAAAGVAATTTGGLVLAGALAVVSIVGVTAGAADGAQMMGESVSDRPPAPHEQQISTAVNILSIVASAPTMVTASESFILNEGLSVGDKLGLVGIVVDRIGQNGEGSPSLAAQTQTTACIAMNTCSTNPPVNDTGDGTSYPPPDLNGCWHLTLLNYDGSTYGRNAWSIIDNGLSDVWQYTIDPVKQDIALVKQEIHSGSDMKFGSVVIKDIESEIYAKGSGEFSVNYSYGIYAHLNDGTLSKTTRRSGTFNGTLEQDWNNGQPKWTGKMSGTFSITEFYYYEGCLGCNGWGNSNVFPGTFTGHLGTCLDANFNPNIQISVPEPVYADSTATFTASLPDLTQGTTWHWAQLGSLSHNYTSDSDYRLSLIPYGAGKLVLWVTATIDGLVCYGLREVTVVTPVE